MSNNLKPALDAFEAGAGFSTNYLGFLIGSLGMVVVTAWALWVLWSVWRGLKDSRTTKTKLITVSQRVAVVWSVMMFLLFYGVIS